MAQIRIDLAEPLLDGMDIKFKAPCNCNEVTGLKVYYPQGDTTSAKEFTFRDTHGNDLTGLGNLFFAGTYVKVLVDTQNGYAYLQNADTNAYLEMSLQLNLADNSDFTQFIAQAGVGGKHGTKAYAGDRWILDSGAVNGEARSDGNGYTNITLNGTIRQIVVNAPDVGTAAIEMVSGTADISYANGEITITSNGGVIKNVRLFKGNYTADNMAAYQPKGYGVELAKCQKYYCKIESPFVGVTYTPNGDTRTHIPFPETMRVTPSIILQTPTSPALISGSNESGVNIPITVEGFAATTKGIVGLTITNSQELASYGTVVVVGSQRLHFEISADFPED